MQPFEGNRGINQLNFTLALRTHVLGQNPDVSSNPDAVKEVLWQGGRSVALMRRRTYRIIFGCVVPPVTVNERRYVRECCACNVLKWKKHVKIDIRDGL